MQQRRLPLYRIGKIGILFLIVFIANAAQADVPTGSEDGATKYYALISAKLGFSSPDKISSTTLDDVAAYLGYEGLSGIDLQNLPSAVLMNPDQLLAPCTNILSACENALQNRDKLLATLGTPKIRPGDILVSRFFAPKIVNITKPDILGWRKLVRLKARPGSLAAAHHISSGIILFNFFTNPGQTAFTADNDSFNTQVMLITELSQVPLHNSGDNDTLYWLDYDTLSKGGKLSLALNASFDSNQLASTGSTNKNYFVPNGCVACHGGNPHRSIVNYLDTDHWFDRLSNDFQSVAKQDLPLLFDAQTNDTQKPGYLLAFEIIREFNVEADTQAKNAQPSLDETLSSHKWLTLHASDDNHFAPVERAIGPNPQWSTQNFNDAQTLSILNQYCFRCHGSVIFSVFDKDAVQKRRADIIEKIDPNAPPDIHMPTDRNLPDDALEFLRQHLPKEGE